MTLLDAAQPPGTTGLVDLGTGTKFPAEFHPGGPRLFGQGVRLDVERVTVAHG